MTLYQAMSSPTVMINGSVISYKPNSITYKKALSDDVVIVEAAGGGQTVATVARDISTKKSYFKMDITSRKANIDLLETMKENNYSGGNVIELSEGTNVEAFKNMILTTNPDIAVGVDGMITVEFEGQ